MREMALKKGSFTGNKHTGGLNMEITLEQLNEKIDNLSRLTLISSKTVLDFEETILFTGLSKGHLYRLTLNFIFCRNALVKHPFFQFRFFEI